MSGYGYSVLSDGDSGKNDLLNENRGPICPFVKFVFGSMTKADKLLLSQLASGLNSNGESKIKASHSENFLSLAELSSASGISMTPLLKLLKGTVA